MKPTATRTTLLCGCLILGSGMAPQSSEAGAWLKDKGETYLSFGIDHDRWGTWMSLYGERGWTDRFTLGVSLGGRENPLMPITGMDVEGYAFVRGAIPGGAEIRIAWQVGAGGKLDEAEGVVPQTYLGGAIGRGFDGGRWANLDLAAVSTFHPDEPMHELRADAAVGLGETRFGRIVIEGSARFDGGSVDYSITPSLGRSVRGYEARAGVRLGEEIGLRLRIDRSF